MGMGRLVGRSFWGFVCSEGDYALAVIGGVWELVYVKSEALGQCDRIPRCGRREDTIVSIIRIDLGEETGTQPIVYVFGISNIIPAMLNIGCAVRDLYISVYMYAFMVSAAPAPRKSLSKS